MDFGSVSYSVKLLVGGVDVQELRFGVTTLGEVRNLGRTSVVMVSNIVALSILCQRVQG